MAIQFVRDWKGYRAGRVMLNPPGGWANVLIRRGIVKVVEPVNDAQVQSTTQQRAGRRTRKPD